MTTPTACQSRCSLHSKRDTHLPCRACVTRHSRPALRSLLGKSDPGLTEVTDTPRGHTANAVASPDPALPLDGFVRLMEPRSALRARAGSPRHS